MTNSKIRKLYVVLLILYLGAVAWLCFGSFDNAPSIKESFLGIPTDKLIHFSMFLFFLVRIVNLCPNLVNIVICEN